MKAKRQNREQQLLILAGFVAGVVTMAQMNLGEVLRVDRFQHMSLSALLVVIVFSLLPNRPIRFIAPFIMVLGVGVLKELYDPSFSELDLMADLVGVVLGGMILLAINPLKRLSRA